MKIDVEKLKKNMKTKSKVEIPSTKSMLSTGNTLLNIACSGKINGGIPKGIISLIVGDSSSRKTWIILTCLAEASINPEFDDYRLVFKNSENGALMDIEKFFGPKLKSRIEIQTPTVLEDFYDDFEDELKSGKPMVVVQDSMDCLRTRDEVKQASKEKLANKKGKEISGSYGMSKPKINSARMKVINDLVKKTNSIFIIVSQTRHNIGFGSQFDPKTRSGGDALRFYSRLEFWLSLREKIKKRVNGKERGVGERILVKFKKNHVSGWDQGRFHIPFYRATGMDDIGGCVDFLIEEKHWMESKGIIKAKEFDVELDREALIKHIEFTDEESTIRKLVLEVWKKIELESKVTRKNKYE